MKARGLPECRVSSPPRELLDALQRAFRLDGSPSFTRPHVISITGREEEKPSARGNLSLIVVDGDVALANDLEPVSLYDNRRVFIESDAEQLRVGLDHFDQVEVAIAPEQMLVDPNILQQPEPFDVISDHQGIGLGVAPD